VTISRRLFAVGAVVLLVWTAAIEFVVRGADHPAPARPSQPAAVYPRIIGPAMATHELARTKPVDGTAQPPSRAANDASDPAAAGPAVIRDPALTRLARRWCAAYLRWGLQPRGSAAAALRALSAPRLFASLAARPPLPSGAPASPVTVGQVQIFAAANGYSAIVDLDGDGADVVLELLITPTTSGPRVSALYL